MSQTRNIQRTLNNGRGWSTVLEKEHEISAACVDAGMSSSGGILVPGHQKLAKTQSMELRSAKLRNSTCVYFKMKTFLLIIKSISKSMPHPIMYPDASP